MIEWDVAFRAVEGEELSGDLYLVEPRPGRVLVAVIDGIGHGPEAVLASRKAVSTIQSYPDQSLMYLFTICHKTLRSTRGVVMMLAEFDLHHARLNWLGVGNVQSRLIRMDKTSSRSEEELLVLSGIVGHTLPPTLLINTLPVAEDDVLILATDGIRREFTEGLFVGKPAKQIANDILIKHSKGTDDALVMVARYQGVRA